MLSHQQTHGYCLKRTVARGDWVEYQILIDNGYNLKSCWPVVGKVMRSAASNGLWQTNFSTVTTYVNRKDAIDYVLAQTKIN
jgi:hypothetical protein